MSVNVSVSGNRPCRCSAFTRNLTWTFAVTELNIRNSLNHLSDPSARAAGEPGADMIVYRTVLGTVNADAVRYGGKRKLPRTCSVFSR